ncbi:hypothetical protein HN51_006113 [Arachis hypogaea]|uniref:uncharacterized protein n=1 Tax=Arachis hypogaea TaxID=3818 RepID=UPI000DEC54B9|nr:uncharacterized protein DS421_4g133880 [Arachis hypogaea]
MPRIIPSLASTPKVKIQSPTSLFSPQTLISSMFEFINNIAYLIANIIIIRNNMSFLGGMRFKELSTSQILSLITDRFYDQIVERDIKDFPGFHLAILDIFRTINAALPGKHYDVPPQDLVKDLFESWNAKTNEKERKEVLSSFMKKNVKINKVDESMIITAIVAPPAAMVVKRTGQTLPQLKLMKSVPDVVFVPSFTVVALIAVKIARMLFMKKTIPPPPPKEEQPQEEHHRPSPTSTQISTKPPADDNKSHNNNNNNNNNNNKHATGYYCEECGIVHH